MITPDDVANGLKSRDWRLRNLYCIVDEQGKKQRFIPNEAQEHFLSEMHNRNIIVKPRQVGFTTLIQLIILDAALWIPNTACGTIAHRLDDAKEIVNKKINFAYDNLPDAIKAMVPKTSDNAMSIKFANGSSIIVGTSLRSGTYQYLHISEYGKICAKYPDKAKEIKAGSLNTAHLNSHVFIESTAEGRDGDFYEKCMYAKAQKGAGALLSPLDYKFHFWPWYRDKKYELYQHVEQPSHLMQYYDKLQSESDIVLSTAQRAWYAVKWQEQQDDMKQEYPSTAEEAFSGAVDGSYYAEAIGRLEDDGHITSVPYDPSYPVNTAWDLGIGDSTTIWFYQHIMAEIRIIGYYEAAGQGIEHFCDVTKQKRYIYDTHYWPHDGNNKSLVTGQELKKTAENFGLNIKIIPRAAIKEGIQKVRSILPRCWFDRDGAAEGLKALRAYRKEYNDKMKDFTQTPCHNWASHAADAFRMLATAIKSPAMDNSAEVMRQRRATMVKNTTQAKNRFRA